MMLGSFLDFGPSLTDIYLYLQGETLLRQLETKQLDIDATLEELNIQQETEDQNYDMYVTMSIHTPLDEIILGSPFKYTESIWRAR